jgi:hypothetical protein
MEEMRKAIAAAMTRSKQTIPHFYLSETIDVDPAIRFLEARNAGEPADRTRVAGRAVRARRDDRRGQGPGDERPLHGGGGYQPPTRSTPASRSRCAAAGSWRPR